jgi:hypothetical protein
MGCVRVHDRDPLAEEDQAQVAAMSSSPNGCDGTTDSPAAAARMASGSPGRAAMSDR